MEPTELETSIGVVRLEAKGRDWFEIDGPFLDKSDPQYDPRYPHHARIYAYPHVHFLFDNRSGAWAPERRPTYYGELGEREVSVPQPLFDELLKLGIEWANAHPEKFEQAAKEEFEDLIGYITRDFLDEIAAKLKEAHEATSKALKEPEFALHASVALRRRVKSEAQRLRIMRGQISGAAKAINTLAGKRPFGPVNQSAV
jgi:hypothetical protein